MILHTVNKSPFANHCLEDCLAVCAPDDSILLIEDGVYAATIPANTMADTMINTIRTHAHQMYALRADVEARGLLARIDPAITLVDDEEFVKLATDHKKIVSWY